MKTRRLLRTVRHRAMITPVDPLRSRLIHVIPSQWCVEREASKALALPPIPF